MEAARNAAHSTMQTVEAVGEAANVSATEMPRFNNNMETGINTFNDQATRANQTGVDAVAQLSNTNEELSRANNNMATGINDFNEQAARANQTGVDAVAQLSNTNEELSRANNTMATGINDFNDQVNVANQTGIHAVGQLSELNETASNFTNVISDFLSLTPLAIAAHLIGPMQMFAMANFAVLILKNLNIIRPPPPAGLTQLTVTLNHHNDDYLTVETPQIVKGITGDSKSSMIYNNSNNSITLYFFYTRNNVVAEQLKGDNYLAFDSFLDMMTGVFELNVYLATGTTIKERHSVVYFLDPRPPVYTLSHMEFSGIHQNIRFVNVFSATQSVTLSSVKVLKDCTATFEYFNICKIDATNGGEAHLHHCRVSWNLHLPNPFLFDGVPSAFDNPHNVCGTVSYNECWSDDSCSTQNGFVKKSVLGRRSKKFWNVVSKSIINNRGGIGIGVGIGIVVTMQSMLFGIATFAVVLSKMVLIELWRMKSRGAYSVDKVLRVMVRGLQCELDERMVDATTQPSTNNNSNNNDDNN
jgi:hypothetical protein